MIKKARNVVWKLFEETPLAELKKQYPFLKEADSQGIANAYMNLQDMKTTTSLVWR